MPALDDAALEARFANLDANAIIDLCTSLADYGEAGGLSPELMMQVGRYAEARYAGEPEVLFAVGRMFLAGGETLRARGALVSAARLGMDEGIVLPVLDEVLGQLRDPRSAEEVLREPPEEPPPARTGGALRTATAVSARKPTPRAVSAPLSQRGQGAGLTALRAAAARAAALRAAPPDEAPARPRAPAEPHDDGPALAERPRPRAPVDPSRAAADPRGRGAPAARAPVEDPPARPQTRTELSRRSSRRKEAPVEPSSMRRGVPAPQGFRSNRIRMLEPDDERRRLDPYELIGEVASGGMATVFLGRLEGHGGFSRLVAVKQLHAHLAREEQFVQMFLDEARLAAAIHHPHVVPILEVGMSKAGYFLVMEFIEGDTLSGLTARSLQRGLILPPRATIRIVLDALAGLHAAHQLTDGEGKPLGLVHRDCTPQNILVGVDGSARITDFGVARAASRLAITRPQQVKGKVGYLSPEQAHAQDVDRRSDLFTMGIVLWEALAGRPLFHGDTEAATLSRLIAGPIPSVQSFVTDVPPAIDEVCRRALQRDKSRRFRSAAEMAEALERAAHADGFGGAASPRELGKFVTTTMGADLVAQREAIRLAPRLAPRLAGTEGRRGPGAISDEPPSMSGSTPRPPAQPARNPLRPPPLPAIEAPPTFPDPEPEAAEDASASASAGAPQKRSVPPQKRSVPPPSDTRRTASVRPPALADDGSPATANGASVPPPVSGRGAALSSRSGSMRALPGGAPPFPPDAGAGAPGKGEADTGEPTPPPSPAVPRSAAGAAPGNKRTPGLGSPRNIALAVLMVFAATSPLWARAAYHLLRGPPAEIAGVPGRKAHPAALPAPPQQPQHAWDEGEWALPDGGSPQVEPGQVEPGQAEPIEPLHAPPPAKPEPEEPPADER
jgi:eukaryotic-like serine/threonine-protein kinase